MAEGHVLQVASLKRRLRSVAAKIASRNDMGRLALVDKGKVAAFKGQFRSLDKNYERYEALVEELTDLCEAADRVSEFPAVEDDAVSRTAQRYFNEANTNYVIFVKEKPSLRPPRSVLLGLAPQCR